MDVIVVAHDAGRREALGRLARSAGWTVRDRIAAVRLLDDAADDVDVLLVEADDIRAARLEPHLVAGRTVLTESTDGDLPALLGGWRLHGWAVVPPGASVHAWHSAAESAIDGFGVAAPDRAAPAGRRDGASAGGDDPPVEPLSPRERAVLELLADGLSNKQIAARLGVTDHTAKFHVASIFGKLGVTTRAAAVRRGLRRGWVSL
jgi:DNA-binding NarL/FixJ family response regulator